MKIKQVKQAISFAGAEAWTTLKRPGRLRHLFRPSHWKRKIDYWRVRKLGDRTWQGASGVMQAKQFSSYEDYLRLQESKLQFVDLSRHEVKFREALKTRLSRLPLLSGRTALCLAARLGAEVRAFRDLGYFAIGIDLNPGIRNDAVCYGDFHDLQYPPGSVDVVYSNSIDHALQLGRLFGEIRRILHPQGKVIVEADLGYEDAGEQDFDLWATTRWAHVEDLERAIVQQGFSCIHREPFEYPRHGRMLVFEVVDGTHRAAG